MKKIIKDRTALAVAITVIFCAMISSNIILEILMIASFLEMFGYLYFNGLMPFTKPYYLKSYLDKEISKDKCKKCLRLCKSKSKIRKIRIIGFYTAFFTMMFSGACLNSTGFALFVMLAIFGISVMEIILIGGRLEIK